MKKKCRYCKNEIIKNPHESYKQFNARVTCSVKCQASAKKGKPNILMLGNKYRLGIKMSKKEKVAISKKLKGIPKTAEHIEAARQARWKGKTLIIDQKLMSKEKLYEYRYFYSLRRNYNLSKEDYERMLVEQNFVCAICGKPNKHKRRLCVDHCHKTKRVRGLLCVDCNIALGHVDDTIEILSKMINYLLSK